MVQVETCPKTPEEIKKASEALACGNDVFQHNQYMCLPNIEKTSLVEFCFGGIMGIQVEGIIKANRISHSTCVFHPIISLNTVLKSLE